MDSKQAEREITTKRDELFNLLDSLIQATIAEQSGHFPPGKSATFQLEFKKLRELEEQNKALQPIVNAVREVEEMVKAMIPEINPDLPDMLRDRKKKLEKKFETLLWAIKRNR